MKKQFIKCDFCEKELDQDKDPIYLTMQRTFNSGWTTYSKPIDDSQDTKDMCMACVKKYLPNIDSTKSLFNM